MSSYVPGQRVSFDGALCTVRYVGDVEGTKGEWLGVEWDNPNRGKHSGEHHGVRYFECRSKHPTAGSFVRPSRPADTPFSFLEALHEKYASELVHSEQAKQARKEQEESEEDSFIHISGKVVEEVGFEKIRKQLAALHELQIVILDELCIQGVLPQGADPGQRGDELGRIAETCPKVAEFDLSRNLFRQWKEVEDICSQLKLLRSLKINGNRLDNIDGSLKFDRISELSLDETLLPWEDLASLTFRFPSLKSLSASANEFASISTPVSSTITKLTLDSNHFQSLASIRHLVALPNLAHLSLQGNRVRSTGSSTPGSEDKLPLFSSSLTELDLSRNEIDSWSFVNLLPDVFPGLKSLRISRNPLYKEPLDHPSDPDTVPVPMSIDEAYMLTLSRLSSLESLNYTTISPQDRYNGELYYLSRIAKELSRTPLSEEQAVLASHPRYYELCETYGAPTIKRAQPTEAGGINPKSLEAHLITFTFYMLPAKYTTNNTEDTIHKIEIPKSFDIYRIKAIISRLFSLAPLRFKLMWETEEWDPVDETKVGEDEWDSEDDMEDAAEESVKVAPVVDSGDSDGNKYVRREVELTDSTREVGFWFSSDAREAKVRVERRQ